MLKELFDRQSAIQNELDKTHPRYLLTREFLLNNQFK